MSDILDYSNKYHDYNTWLEDKRGTSGAIVNLHLLHHLDHLGVLAHGGADLAEVGDGLRVLHQALDGDEAGGVGREVGQLRLGEGAPLRVREVLGCVARDSLHAGDGISRNIGNISK